MFRLDIAVENSAFEPVPGPEVARILRAVADRVERGEESGKLNDINGNKVGYFDYLPDRI